MLFYAVIRFINWGLYWENGKENGIYSLGFRALGVGG